MKMNRWQLLAILAFISLACGQIVAPTTTPANTQLPTLTPLPTLTRTAKPEIANTSTWTTTVTRPLVNVRQSPNGKVVDTLRTGTEVEIVQCSGNWCKIREPAGYVWRGCLSDNPAKLGCAAK